MTTKLVSMNLGVRLELIVDGKPKMVEWSAVCPSGVTNIPQTLTVNLMDWLEEQLELRDWYTDDVRIEKPKRIKAHRPLSQDEFNRRIAELGK